MTKYKKPAVLAAQDKEKEDEERKQRLAKEKQRMMGRKMPSKADAKHERELMRLATKGVV